MNEARIARPGVVYLPNRMVIVAGGQDKSFLSTVECLRKKASSTDGWESSWNNLAPMNQPRCYFGFNIFQNHVLAVGGRIADTRINTSAVEMFRPPNGQDDPGQWTVICNLPKPMQTNAIFQYLSAPNELTAIGKLRLLPLNEIYSMKLNAHALCRTRSFSFTLPV